MFEDRMTFYVFDLKIRKTFISEDVLDGVILMDEKQWRDKEDEKVLEILKRKNKEENAKYAAKYSQRSRLG